MRLSSYIEEIKSFWFFYNRMRKSEREIVFYSEDAASYSYFEGLIKQLTTKYKLKICYITSDRNDPLFEKNLINMKVLHIKSFLRFFIGTLNSKILIMTMPDLHRMNIKRSSFGTHHIYMFHNIGSSFPVIRFGALFYYDTIFCVGPHHNEEIRRQEEIYNLPEKYLLNFGYYRLEKIAEEYKRYIPSKKNRSSYKAKILLGPSWGDNSILNLCGNTLIRTLLQSGYEVVVRPHPMTLKETPHLITSLNDKFNNYDNYIYADDISSVEAIYESDVLISDWSGFVYEYAFGTERPVLFIDVPRKIVNERHEEVGIEPMDVGIRKRIGTILGLHELDKVDIALTDLLSNKDAYIKEIISARNEYVYNFGKSSLIGADYIVSLLKGEINNASQVI
jgi:CDP-glycerol glycerophosphotransferase (TagB/SpsB family)